MVLITNFRGVSKEPFNAATEAAFVSAASESDSLDPNLSIHHIVALDEAFAAYYPAGDFSPEAFAFR